MDRKPQYLREWLSHQAASNYLSYDAASATFSLAPEQAMVFANEESPVYMMADVTETRSIKCFLFFRRNLLEQLREGFCTCSMSCMIRRKSAFG
jgi:hypothetical protein